MRSRTTAQALDDRGGSGTLRNLRVDAAAPVPSASRSTTLAWQLDLSPKGAAFNPLCGERASVAGAVAIDRASKGARSDDVRPLLRRFSEEDEGAAFRPLVALLEGYRVYGTYDLRRIRTSGSQVVLRQAPLPRRAEHLLRPPQLARPQGDATTVDLRAGGSQGGVP